MSILQKLRYASFEDFEKLGREKVYTAINDARTLGNVPQLFINTFNSLIMVLCCLVYMFWISWVGGLIVLGLMSALLVIYLVRNKRAERDLNELRDLQNDYYRYLRDLLQGFKEIKMSILRNDNIFTKFLSKNRKRGRLLSLTTSARYMNNELTGSYSWYILLGAIMFLLPQFFGLAITQVSAFLVTILYLIGPTAGLITFLPIVTRVKIALNRLSEYEHLLDANTKGRIMHGDMQDINKVFSQIEFVDVTYEYYDKEKNSLFVFGPVNVTLSAGEKIFITGGNGSGKTTFVKLLTGLYKPTSGAILLNGHPITDENYPYYRDQLSAIFTDHHIFNENYNDFDLGTDNRKLESYIEMMHLSEIIRVQEDQYQLNDALSQGQKKRLALVMAMLESRHVMVLDEWAAEQDPQFRAYFYRKILTWLQSSDKTIIAITHDDAYYHLADRIIKFDFGKIVSDGEPEPAPHLLLTTHHSQ
jgi:cyclic peptide transporter